MKLGVVYGLAHKRHTARCNTKNNSLSTGWVPPQGLNVNIQYSYLTKLLKIKAVHDKEREQSKYCIESGVVFGGVE